MRGSPVFASAAFDWLYALDGNSRLGHNGRVDTSEETVLVLGDVAYRAFLLPYTHPGLFIAAPCRSSIWLPPATLLGPFLAGDVRLPWRPPDVRPPYVYDGFQRPPPVAMEFVMAGRDVDGFAYFLVHHHHRGLPPEPPDGICLLCAER